MDNRTLIAVSALGLAVLWRFRGALSVSNSVRDQSIAACQRVVPCDYGDPQFSVMTGGIFTEDFGSSCGYLTSLALQDIGCRDGRILNRTEAEPDQFTGEALVYVPGDNISKLVGGAKANGSWRTLADGPPKRGDLLFFSLGPAHTEHVSVFDHFETADDGTTWLSSYDAGRTNQAGHQCARYLSEYPDATGENHFTTAMRRCYDNGTFDFVGGARPLVGYVDIEAVPTVPGLAVPA